MKAFSITLIITAMALLSSCESEGEWKISSPSGNVSFTLKAGQNGSLSYSIYLDGKMITGESPIGIIRNDNQFATGLEHAGSTSITPGNDSFVLLSGKRKQVETAWNEQAISFRNSVGAGMQITIRVFDDGVAFRYRFPEASSTTYTVESELTGFAVPENSRAWIQPYDKVTTYSPAYETYYNDGIPAGTPAPSGEGWSFPALFSTENGWMLITEASVDPGYAGMHLNREAEKNIYTLRMPEETEANNIFPGRPSSSLPWEMPWRVVIVSKEISGIVESDIAESLNPGSMISDPSWISPGRASWSWWSDPPSPKNYASQKKFVDFAASMGWEYCLVDANWDMMEGGTIGDLVKYAKSRNVGIWLWYNSGGDHNSVTERPRDLMSDPVRRKEEFAKLASWGVKGVKVDFFQSDKQGIISQYFDILRDGAENRVMVNFHGCTLPRGWRRTWPNLMSMEAVRGAECYIFDSLFTSMAPVQNTILPFTRNVVGPMDYTPVALTDHNNPHLTTFAHEIALTVIFESGILHFADKPEAYLSQPAEALKFLKEVPAAWDKSLLLSGEPGKHCVFARLKDGKWYLAGINGTSAGLSLNINLGRIGTAPVSAEIITDGNGPRDLKLKTVPVSGNGNMAVDLLPYGGFAGVLKY